MGQMAPEFVLKDQDGKDVRLSQLKSSLVLLSFHPLAWTEVCAKQMQALEQNKGTFESLGTIPLGLSVDTVPSKKAWADHLGIKSLRMLSDFWPHGEAAKAYGIFREKGRRQTRCPIGRFCPTLSVASPKPRRGKTSPPPSRPGCHRRTGPPA